MNPLSRSASAVGAVAVLTLALSACGAGASNSPSTAAQNSSVTPAATTEYPLTVENCGLSQSFDKAPSRVAILNGNSIAEVQSVLALGLAKSVVANAQKYGVYDDPSMAQQISALPTVSSAGSTQRDIPAETLLNLKPDLVIANSFGAFDAGKGMATREQLAAIGAKTLINPDQCALGKASPTAEEQTALANASWASAKTFYTLLGKVFNVQAKAQELNQSIDQRVKSVADKIGASGSAEKKPTVLVAFPGMSMMNSNGLPAVMTGSQYDSLLGAAGAQNAFTGQDRMFTRSLSAEQLAAAKVDVLVLGRFTAAEDAKTEAEKLFAAYPQWEAAKNKRFVSLADSAYLGPHNALAIEKIAQVTHPDAFS